MTAEALEDFFGSGHAHVDHVLRCCRKYFDPTFAPDRVLDFGCGVGRLLFRFAEIAREVVGMDVSASMLAEAWKNCEVRDVQNIFLVLSDDTLSAAEGKFALVHSSIVLQHIEVRRGRALFAQLVDKVQAGGVGAIHVTFGWDAHPESFGVPPELAEAPLPPSRVFSQAKANVRRLLDPLGGQQTKVAASPESANPDPEMQMNYYNLSELSFILQRAGVQRFHTEFTDHGGALGAMLYFQKPAA